MQQQPRLPLWFMVATLALIVAAFALGMRLGGARTADLPQQQLAALAIVHKEILASHVDPQLPDRLLDKAISAMVAGLDPYSRYVPATDVTAYEERNTGHYEGIGADFDTHGEAVVLHFPLAGSPAESAGLLPGDELLAVDGVSLDTAESRGRVVDLVRGKAGTDVRLRLRRDGTTRDVVVRRGDVQRPCVKWASRLGADAQFGYVHLTDFYPDSAPQLFAAIDALRHEGPLLGLVLDLRGNGGGNLEECLAIARAFVRSGLIVTQFRRKDVEIERHEAKPETCRYPDLPLVVLVNEHSASASEVLAGALQDHGRAAVVGVRTHGKALVNTVYQWKGHDFRLKLTTGRYRTPNGRDIERHHNAAEGAADSGGIAPDLAAPIDDAAKAAVYVALQQRECPVRHRAAFAAMAPRHGITVPGPPQPANDAQLAQAVTALQQRVAVPANTKGGRADKDK